MDELKRALDIAEQISVTGSAREGVLTAFEKQIKAWDVALPDVEPLVWDFGLKDFYKVGLIEYWITNEIAAGYCAKYLFVFDGQTCPMHRHKTKVETFFIVKGKVSMEYAGSVREMAPGDALLVEAGKPHSFTGLGPALLMEVLKPCIVDDNYFEDVRIPIGGNYRKGAQS